MKRGLIVVSNLYTNAYVEAGRRLTEAGATYPWALCDVDPKPYRLNSGLFVASRYPVIDPEFIRFSIASRDDILAGKVTTPPLSHQCHQLSSLVISY
jgi:hypothetical protein